MRPETISDSLFQVPELDCGAGRIDGESRPTGDDGTTGPGAVYIAVRLRALAGA